MKKNIEMKKVNGFKQPIATPDAERIGGGAPEGAINPKLKEQAQKIVKSLKKKR